MLCRDEGLLSVPPAVRPLGPMLSRKPKLSRETGRSVRLVVVVVLGRLRLERTVTFEGRLDAARGEARGGVVVGAGNLE